MAWSWVTWDPLKSQGAGLGLDVGRDSFETPGEACWRTWGQLGRTSMGLRREVDPGDTEALRQDGAGEGGRTGPSGGLRTGHFTHPRQPGGAGSTEGDSGRTGGAVSHQAGGGLVPEGGPSPGHLCTWKCVIRGPVTWSLCVAHGGFMETLGLGGPTCPEGSKLVTREAVSVGPLGRLPAPNRGQEFDFPFVCWEQFLRNNLLIPC